MKWLITAVLAMVTLCMIGYQIQQNITAKYEFEKDYGFAWSLADKSSTIEAKASYINQFVSLLESNKYDFAQYNAKRMKTPDNSFEMNLSALKTLSGRLREVMTMDVKSFEYQTAIQQITQQEQGEAGELIGVVYGCWLQEKHPVIWEWHQIIWVLMWIGMGLATFISGVIADCD